MSYHSCRILKPAGSSRKRKAMEAYYSYSPKPSSPPQSPTQPGSALAADPVSSNRLLAGYMAYEFLTRGMVLGQKFVPAPAEASLLSPRAAAAAIKSTVAEPSTRSAAPAKQHQSYAEVASLLKTTDGAHIAGIVNPTQLSRWIQM